MNLQGSVGQGETAKFNYPWALRSLNCV